MSTAERAGAVLMTAGTADELPSLHGLIRDRHLGGVMVRGRSAAGTSAVARAVSAAVTGVALRPLVATDQEGGEVQVLSGPGFSEIPSAVDQARLPAAALQRRAAGWAGELRAAGVDLALGPVADVPCAADRYDNPPIADLDREYGDGLQTAGAAVAAVVRGTTSAGVATAVKHFPGLGCVTANTDTTSRVVDGTTTAGSDRLGPFRAGVLAGTPVVMVSSAVYPRMDGSAPALFCHAVIGGVLRGRLGFGGVVMSDDVGGAAALRAWSPGERATRFVAAGGDLMLDIVPADVPAEVRALTAKAAADPAFSKRLADAAIRVTTLRLELQQRDAASLKRG